MGGEIVAFLYFGSIGLLAAIFVMAIQAAMMDIESRLGQALMRLIPPAIVASIGLTAAFSGRNLKALSNDPSAADFADVGWLTRSITALLLSYSIACVVGRMWKGRVAGEQKYVQERSAIAGQLYFAIAVYIVAVAFLPMFLSANPRPTYKGLVVFALFTAAYVSRGQPLAPIIRAAQWSLALMIGVSFVLIGVRPDMVLESAYAGSIPGLNSRFWGLAFHANGMGALAFMLLLLQYMQPSRRWAVNALVYLLASAALILAQSKTVWLVALVSALLLFTIQVGRDRGGRLRLGYVAALALLVGIAVLAVPFLDWSRLIMRFEHSALGASVTTLTGRPAIWSAAIRMWLDNPVFGYGLEAWGLEHRLKLGLPFAVHAHNQLLQALSTAGLVGGMAFLLLVIQLFRASWRAIERTKGVALVLCMFILIRCFSEAPLEVGRILSSDVLALLLLFMFAIDSDRRTAGVEESMPPSGKT